MDHDNTGGVVSGGCVDCGHNHCDFDLSLSHNFEERYVYKCVKLVTCLQRELMSIEHAYIIILNRKFQRQEERA